MSEKEPKSQSNEDLQRLAKEYVDLWEQQVKALAGDDGFASAMTKTFELMNAGAASMATMAGTNVSRAQGAHDESRDDAELGADAQFSSDQGTQAAGASSGHSDHDINQLLERIGELEGRVAELERGHASPRRRSSKSD